MWDMRPPMDAPMPNADDVVWLTYDALAIRLGITPESCRNLVRRRRWARQDGNDGARRIGVPAEYLAERDDTPSPADGAIDPPIDGASDVPLSGGAYAPAEGAIAAVLTTLERHIERLEGELAETKAELAAMTVERDTERAVAAQVEALRSVLEVERARAGTAEQDRDRWHAEAQQDRAARLADAEKAQAQADAIRAELADWKARPWWRRVLG